MSEYENNKEQFSEVVMQTYLLMEILDKKLLADERMKYRENGVVAAYCMLGRQYDIAPDNPLVDSFIAQALDPPTSVTISAWGPYSLDGNDRASQNQNMTTRIEICAYETETEYVFTYRPDDKDALCVRKEVNRVYGVRDYNSMGTEIVDGSALIEPLNVVDTISVEELARLYLIVEDL